MAQMTMSMTRKELLIDELNTVETSVEIWSDFIEESMRSDFYRKAVGHTKDLERAAAFTLLQNYLRVFSEAERRRVLSDVEEFYRYAKGFISELSPYRYDADGYNARVRAVFFGKIRQLLRSTKNDAGEIIEPERYVFIRTLVKFCSSLGYIIKLHDEYKEFLFRDLPQIR